MAEDKDKKVVKEENDGSVAEEQLDKVSGGNFQWPEIEPESPLVPEPVKDSDRW